MKTIKLTLSVLIAGIMLISLVSAFGVSSPYWDGNPLTMARGETKTINLNLQNMVGSGDVTVKAVLVEGADITSLPKDTYVVKEGTSDTMVPLEISIPKDANPGEITPIKVEFKTVQDSSKGITMGTGMTVAFNVIAGEAVAETNTSMIVGLILAIIILALIIWMILKKRKKR